VTVPTAFLVPFVLVWDGKKHEGFWEDMAFLVHWKLRNDNFEHALVGHSPLILPCRTDSGKVS
jgi:hypothetical protein